MQQTKEMSRNIARLEKIISEKEGFIALALTRLSNRKQRTSLELTRDSVEISLQKEVADLRAVVDQLHQTLIEVNNIYIILYISLFINNNNIFYISIIQLIN